MNQRNPFAILQSMLSPLLLYSLKNTYYIISIILLNLSNTFFDLQLQIIRVHVFSGPLVYQYLRILVISSKYATVIGIRVRVESKRAFKKSLKFTVHQKATTNAITPHEKYFPLTLKLNFFLNVTGNTLRVGVEKKGGGGREISQIE